MPFVDKINLKVSSGNGGPGCLSFSSSKHKVKGGPDGGDGGDGGDVFLKVDPAKTCLSHLNPYKTYQAESGLAGGSRKKRGKKGKDLWIHVPPSTWLSLDKKGRLLKNYELYLLAQGGNGGRGNKFFTSSKNQSPRKVTPGKRGQTLRCSLEMRLEARVSFLGLHPISHCSILEDMTKKSKRDQKATYSCLFRKTRPRLISFEGVGIIELPSLSKTKGSFLKHSLSSRLIVLVFEFDDLEKFFKDYKKVIQILKNHEPLLLEKKIICYIYSYKKDGILLETQETIQKFFKNPKPCILFNFQNLERTLCQYVK